MKKECVHHLFAEHLAEHSSRVALVHGRRRMTYADLDRWSNRVAHWLMQAGVRPDDAVAICAGRSVEMVGAVLGSHKAGAAYVPLDASLPEERMTFMLSDCGARVLLTQRSVWGTRKAPGVKVLYIEDCPIHGIADTVPAVAVSPEHLAYVIYTSGSTGRPKGIEMPHWVLANLLRWQRQSYTSRPDARWAQYSAFFFDASFVDIYATLCAGGTLYLVSEELRTDFRALAELLASEKVERIYIPVVALGQLSDAVVRGGAPFPEALHEVIVSGEQLKITDAIRELFDKLGPMSALHNQYGPAETHVVTAHPLRPPAKDWPNLPSIGKAITGTELYLLDAALNPVPDGTPGELYIGHTIARGYRGRPDVTAERFLPDPFSRNEGARMYKSGDVAVKSPDGSYEFHGRADFQLKIRGYRVEPLEIELILAGNGQVAQCAIAAYEDASGQRSLAAYVVTAPGAEKDALGLRRFLEARLPGYMVPSTFVFMDKLPMTPSGKLDRVSLPAPSLQRPQAAADAAENAVEAMLLSLWKETFGMDEIGTRDNFFDLGGHSLMALGLLGRTREVFGVDYPLLTLFEGATIAEMAENLLQLAEDPEAVKRVAAEQLAKAR